MFEEGEILRLFIAGISFAVGYFGKDIIDDFFKLIWSFKRK